MTYQVIISDVAEMDIVDTGLYISEELSAPDAADNLLDEIDQQILSLEQMPKRFALVSDERLAQQGIRLIPVRNYLILYFVEDYSKTVTIARVLYGKRNWLHLL